MKQIIILFILLNTSLSYSQNETTSTKLFTKNIDSIQFSIWDIQTKEMSTFSSEEKEYEKELGSVTLSNKDKDLLITNLLNPKSYNGKSALLYHYNLVFDLYKNDSISVTVKISTLTGNITIDNKVSGVYFRNNCTLQFGEVLIALLDYYNFSNYFNEVHLNGITDHTTTDD
ncbi:hypothetical protein [Olleya sp. Bg11-27]|uniref:hypothetical protein n=1 Tax=Olleya sp. Bg11-27 TaxID=2058135 RepID=UPI000C316DB6|nr:hypothetical protein [Olleya sp. Bg11-27]AUC77279.1 hypothetical protein CW732_17005 [Olleya sp. Bg11-27]